MHETIKNFSRQFEYEPKIENAEKLGKHSKFIIAGMGGSNLVTDLIHIRAPQLNIVTHRSYEMPAMTDAALKEHLFIASSYSGNTEETVDAFEKVFAKKLPVAAIATGGKLIDLAKKNNVPYIQMPATGIQPRSALGLNLRAVLKIIGSEDLLKETGELANSLNSAEYESAGTALAEKLKGHVPIIYSSVKNMGIAYNWKIKFNETAKIPAFYNVFPELNHNEMTGFDVIASTKSLSEKFYFIFIKDEVYDHLRIIKRMETLEKLYIDVGFGVEVLSLQGGTPFHKIFSSLILADWTAYHTAQLYGTESEQVPMVEEFKKLITE